MVEFHLHSWTTFWGGQKTVWIKFSLQRFSKVFSGFLHFCQPTQLDVFLQTNLHPGHQDQWLLIMKIQKKKATTLVSWSTKKLKFWWNKITHYLPTQKKHDVCVAPSTLDFGTNFQAGRMGNSANSRLVNQWVGCDKVWSGNGFCLWVLKDKVLVMIYGIIFYVWRFV